MTRGAAPLGNPVANTVMLWCTMIVAASALWPIYRTPQLAVVVGAALLSGTVIALLGARFRWPAPVVALATVVAFVLLGAPLILPEQTIFRVIPTLEGLQGLVVGAALGWKQLLTISLPVGTYMGLLIPFFLLVLVATVLSLTVALRARAGSLAVLGPILLFVVAVLFGPDAAQWPIVTSLALMAAVLGWVALRRWGRRQDALNRVAATAATAGEAGPAPVAASLPQSGARRVRGSGLRRDRRSVGLRTVVSGIVIFAVAGTAAAAAATALPAASPRSVLRTAIVQPFDPRDYVSPLSGFRRYWQEANAAAVMLSVDGLPAGARLRIATLDSYDGIVYSVGSATVTAASGSFTRVPAPIDQSATAGEAVTITVDVGAFNGPWLPTIGNLETIAFAGADSAELRGSFFFNSTTQTAAVLDELAAGDQYTLSAVLPSTPDRAALADVEPGLATVPPAAVIPEELATTLDRYIADAATPGTQLLAMIDGLQADGYVSHGVADDEPASRSGHAADRITELLADSTMIGDAEQYAVTAALMARELGFPARVVLGFAPETAEDTTQVRGSDISAWVEVNTAEYGWVTIDPNPEIRDIPDATAEEPTRISRPQSIVPPPEVEPPVADRQPAPETERDDPAEVDRLQEVLLMVARVAGTSALAALVLSSPFLVIVLAKWIRRRRRRRARSNLDRIRGGWSEFEDNVVDHGFEPSRSATRSEVAATVGSTQAAVLAAVADRAVFAPTEPDAIEADHVWRSVSEIAATLDARITRWQRFRARISLRSLRGYSGRTGESG